MTTGATSSTSDSASYASRGDVANVASVVLAIGYAVCVVYYTQPGRSGVLDETWKGDGFCIHNKNVPYWSSFDTCLYVDTVFSALLGVLYLKWKDAPGMKSASAMVPYVILGTLGHGFAHGAMATKFRDGGDGDAASADNDEGAGLATDRPELWKIVGFAALFWFPLLKASLMSVSSAKVALLSAVVTYGSLWIRDVYGFAYVNTVLSIAFHLSQLLLDREEKQNRQYLTLPLFVAIPPLLTAWNEALFCDAYFKTAGGHVLYDASIILCFIAYYVDAYYWNNRSEASSSKSKTA